MTWWQAAVLGLVQGLAEFLPISSSGHLLLFRELFGLPAENLLLDTFLHMGTLAAVCVVLNKDIAEIFRHLFGKVTWLLAAATVPAVAATLLFEDFFDEAFSGSYLGISFLFTGAVLFLVHQFGNRSQDSGRPLTEVTWRQSISMGVAQAVAILPGVSRSGLTLSGGLASGVKRDTALRFSFLMSIIAIAGSFVLQMVDIAELGWAEASQGIGIFPLVLGTLVSGVTGVIALKWMLAWVRKGKLWVFALYVGVVGLWVLLDQTIMHLVF